MAGRPVALTESDFGNATYWEKRQEQWSEVIYSLLQTIITKENQMASVLDPLVAAVQAQTTVDGSVETLLTGLTKIITDLQAQLAAGGLSAADQATLAAQVKALTAEHDALVAAVTANTPAAPAVGARRKP
jgi:hypothetical protein